MSSIELSRLTFQYDTTPVFLDLDLRLDTDWRVGLVGRNGRGKSTLLHILGLLDRPTGGTILLEGEELARASERRRNLIRARDFAFVFQFYYLLPEFGTRCSTLVSMESNGSWRFIERRFDSAGVNAGESLYSFAVGEDR